MGEKRNASIADKQRAGFREREEGGVGESVPHDSEGITNGGDGLHTELGIQTDSIHSRRQNELIASKRDYWLAGGAL